MKNETSLPQGITSAPYKPYRANPQPHVIHWYCEVCQKSTPVSWPEDGPCCSTCRTPVDFYVAKEEV